MSIVNVTLLNTFEEWRVKTNEIGTAIGDLTSLPSSSDVVSELSTLNTAVGDWAGDYDGASADIVAAINILEIASGSGVSDLTALTARVTTAEGDINTAESNIASNDTDITNLTTRMSDAEGDIGTWANYTGSEHHDTEPADIVTAFNEIEDKIGDMTRLTVPILGHTNIVDAIESIFDGSHSSTVTLYDSTGTQVFP
jgi:hypothetical protein